MSDISTKTDQAKTNGRLFKWTVTKKFPFISKRPMTDLEKLWYYYIEATDIIALVPFIRVLCWFYEKTHPKN